MILHEKIDWKREVRFFHSRDVIQHPVVSGEYLKSITENEKNMKKILFCVSDLIFQ